MTGNVIFDVMDPRACIFEAKRTSLSRRLNALAGKTIGLIWNGKPQANVLLEWVRKALQERIPTLEFKNYMMSSAGSEPKKGELESIAREVEAIIYASGD
jgi:hypothetical protein